jgi:hypothetical protein
VDIRVARSTASWLLQPDQRLTWDVVLMAKVWLDVVGILIVCAVVFLLVALCERERH